MPIHVGSVRLGLEFVCQSSTQEERKEKNEENDGSLVRKRANKTRRPSHNNDAPVYKYK